MNSMKFMGNSLANYAETMGDIWRYNQLDMSWVWMIMGYYPQLTFIIITIGKM